MIPSNLNLNIGKTARYENKIFISNTGMKSDSNKDINKSDFSGRLHGAANFMKSLVTTIEEIGNPKKLGGIHNDEKLAITPITLGVSFIA